MAASNAENREEGNFGFDLETESLMQAPISMVELATSVSGAKLKSAPGLDLISNEIVKRLPERPMLLLLEIYNYIVSEGGFPQGWTKYEVCLIPKPGGKGFRPISLSSVLLKNLERIIKDRLQWWLEQNHHFPDEFYGFRKSRSCYDNIAALTTDIHISFLEAKYLSAVFIDIEGAYDNVNTRILVNELMDLGVPHKIVRLLKNIVWERRISCSFQGNLVDNRIARKGLPQGSILSPILFNIYIRKIVTTIGPNIGILSYADDVAIYTSEKSLQSSLANISNALQVLDQWLVSIDLKIAGHKTQLCIFSKLSFGNVPTLINFNNIQIRNSPSVRFLGVYLDTKLNWKVQIDICRAKAMKATSVIKALAGFRWGAHPSVLIMVFKGLVRAILDWGCMFYQGGSKANLDSLERVQYAALRSCLGCLKTTPTNLLLHLGGITTLSARRTYLSKKFIISRSALSENEMISRFNSIRAITERRRAIPSSLPPLYKIWLNMAEFTPQVMKFNLPSIFKVDYPNLFAKVDIDTELGFNARNSSNPASTFRTETNIKYPDHKLIFIDGSRIPDPPRAAAAVYVIDQDYAREIKLNGHVQ